MRDTPQVVVLTGGGTEVSKLVVGKRIDVAADPVGPALSADDKVIPKFLIDASLSRVARDPEPMLSVRVSIRD